MQLSFSTHTFFVTTFLLLSLLAGCDSDSEPSNATDSADAAPRDLESAASDTAAVNDQALVTLYQRSCFACHSMGAAGAPRTGDAQVWSARIAEKGMDTLVANAINGIGSMPPKGLCNQCTDAEIRDLVVYMSTPTGR